MKCIRAVLSVSETSLRLVTMAREGELQMQAQERVRIRLRVDAGTLYFTMLEDSERDLGVVFDTQRPQRIHSELYLRPSLAHPLDRAARYDQRRRVPGGLHLREAVRLVERGPLVRRPGSLSGTVLSGTVGPAAGCCVSVGTADGAADSDLLLTASTRTATVAPSVTASRNFRDLRDTMADGQVPMPQAAAVMGRYATTIDM